MVGYGGVAGVRTYFDGGGDRRSGGKGNREDIALGVGMGRG